jgi:hypothetical protein
MARAAGSARDALRERKPSSISREQLECFSPPPGSNLAAHAVNNKTEAQIVDEQTVSVPEIP